MHTTGFKEGLLKVAGAIRHPVQTRRWEQFLSEHPPLEELTDSIPGFAARIHQPYYSTRLDCAGRVDLMIGHYEILLRAGFGHLVRQTLLRPMTIYSFAGKSNSIYRLELAGADGSTHNGELVLRMMMGNLCIYTAVFLLTASDGETHVNIGALNGILASPDRIGIKQVTRDLHGCRPKDLMVSLVREAGNCLGCTKTILISNSHKIALPTKPVCKKSSDYDRTWIEMHAVARSDGDYELPCAHIQPMSSSDAALAVVQLMPTKRAALIEAARLALRNRLNAGPYPGPVFRRYRGHELGLGGRRSFRVGH